MTNEVREAMRRLLRIKSGETYRDVYGVDRINSAMQANDESLVCDACLSEHLDDDDVAVNEKLDKLESLLPAPTTDEVQALVEGLKSIEYLTRQAKFEQTGHNADERHLIAKVCGIARQVLKPFAKGGT